MIPTADHAPRAEGHNPAHCVSRDSCPRQSHVSAPVAQLDRALPSGGRVQGFESLRVRHFSALHFKGFYKPTWLAESPIMD